LSQMSMRSRSSSTTSNPSSRNHASTCSTTSRWGQHANQATCMQISHGSKGNVQNKGNMQIRQHAN
jgi:hypothetical protein